MAYSATPALILALAKCGHEMIATTVAHNPEIIFGQGGAVLDGADFTEEGIATIREYAKEDKIKLGTITRLGKERVKASKALLDYMMSPDAYVFYLSDEDVEWIDENHPECTGMVNG